MTESSNSWLFIYFIAANKKHSSFFFKIDYNGYANESIPFSDDYLNSTFTLHLIELPSGSMETLTRQLASSEYTHTRTFLNKDKCIHETFDRNCLEFPIHVGQIYKKSFFVVEKNKKDYKSSLFCPDQVKMLYVYTADQSCSVSRLY